MVKVTDKDFYMDGYLKENLDLAKQVIREDWDMCILCDGVEGGGKSVLIQQVAYYCDPTFNLDRIVFTAKQFQEAVLKAEKYQAIVFDEAYGSLNSRQVLSQTNRALVKMMTEIRQKNLFIFILLPSFFELDRYIALWRSRALIHIYTGDKFERGRFSFFNTDRKKSLYINGKKFFSYSNPKANFFGSFTNFYVVDKDLYQKKKADATLELEKQEPEMTSRLKRVIDDRNAAIKLLLEYNVPVNVIESRLSVEKTTIYDAKE